MLQGGWPLVKLGLDTDALMAHAREHLANYKRPKGIAVWPELPKSAANKILRREVRTRILAEGGDKQG